MKLIGERQCDWDEYLDPVLFSIRTSVQESTKFKTGKRLKQKLNISQLKLYQSSKVDKEELKDKGRTPNKPMDKEGKTKSNKVLPSKVDEKEVKDKQGAPAITFEGEKDKKKSSKEMLQILEDHAAFR